jgi:hypothetical protein
MADPVFRNDQWNRRYEPHIAPLNRLVDQLQLEGGRGFMPYVAPMYGGIHARLLSILRDPGPKTQPGYGSGFLCMENDDATAETIAGYFWMAGISAADIVPWNVYPWYINREPSASELDAGVEPLMRVVDLLPRLRVVMLHGGAAARGWKRFVARFPDVVSRRKLLVISTYHTSRQAFWHADPEVREIRRTHLIEAFAGAARELQQLG